MPELKATTWDDARDKAYEAFCQINDLHVTADRLARSQRMPAWSHPPLGRQTLITPWNYMDLANRLGDFEILALDVLLALVKKAGETAVGKPRIK